MSKTEKLIRLNTGHLQNEVHFRFHFENEKLYTKYDVKKLGIEDFMADFRQALADEDTALERIRKSADTARIAEADARFDNSFSSMHLYLQSFLKHFDPNMRRAAENLDTVFHQFGNIGRQAYRQELASSWNLVQELRKRPEDVSQISLNPWIFEHESAAQALAALLDVRTGDTAQQTDLRTVEVRAEIDAIYRKITDRIDAMININGRDYVPGFVAAYNAHATEYRNTLAQHLGRVHSAGAGAARPDSDDNSDDNNS